MPNELYWRFDVSTFKLLGRELITDRITAIYELVKNCYDANAKNVFIDFCNVETRTINSKIIIRDDGYGMGIKDIENKWLVVGTASKRKELTSPAPFNRRYIGEKGVGRFAVDKLGGHLIIKTKRKKDSKTLNVVINWTAYEKSMLENKQLTLFTEIGNEFYYNNDFKVEQGTELSITHLHEVWDVEKLQRLITQLGRILSPAYKLEPSFNIFINAPKFGYDNFQIIPEPLEKFATIEVNVSINKLDKLQGSLKFNKKGNSFENEWLPKQSFGFVKMKFYYFDQDAQSKFKASYKGTENYIEGVKIYRDGVVCTPFAEYESNVDKRRDVLGVDKRRWNQAFDKLSNREVIGVVEISKDGNPEIIDATNRQDFVDNQEYRDLKDFVIKQIDELAEYKLHQRKNKKVKVQNNLKRASADVKEIAAEVKRIAKANPEIQDSLKNIIAMSGRLEKVIQEGVKDKEVSEKEFVRKENIYLSLMSLQDYAINLAHAIRLLLGKIKRAAEFFKNRYPNPNLDQQFKKYAILMFDEMQRLSKVVDFMLSYAQSDIENTEFTISTLLNDVFNEAYQPIFETEGIVLTIENEVNLSLQGNRKFIEDVLTNLISNSLKALENTIDKKINCKIYIENDTLCFIFSDNGIGIKVGDEHKVFDIYYTTTAEQGGAGLGLFVAKTRMNAINGDIEVIQSIFSPIGASFKITLPLKQFSK